MSEEIFLLWTKLNFQYFFSRFGQVSPRPTDKIPSLDFENKQSKQNGSVNFHDKSEEIPIPPM